MNNKFKILLCSLVGLFSLTTMSCGNKGEIKPETPEGGETQPENPEEPTEKPDFTQKEDNDFTQDPDTEDDNPLIKDETPADKGPYKEYNFEFESSNFEGAIKNYDHICIYNAWNVNPGFSGNVCVKNIVGGSTHSFTFTSDKAVRVPIDVKVSGSVAKNRSFGNFYTVMINGTDWTYCDSKIPNTNLVTPPGANPTYFGMTKVTIEVSLQKGTNVLTFTHGNSDCPNLDGFTIRSSANIIDQTESNWPKIEDNLVVVKAPSKDEGGIVKYGCKLGDEAHNTTAYNSFNVPALSDKAYQVKESATEDEYTLPLGTGRMSIMKHCLLTLKGGATFEDGSTAKKIARGDKPTIKLDTNGLLLKGWKNADKPEEVYPVEFVMGDHPITIEPILEAPSKHTLTLQGATFKSGDTTSQKIEEGSKPEIVVPEIPNKKHVGWANVNDKTQYLANTTYVMGDKDITILPIYEDLKIYPQGNKIHNILVGGDRNDKIDTPFGAFDYANYGAVTNEVGVTLRKNKLDKDQFFTICNHIGIQNTHTYKISLTVENQGATTIKYKLNQFTLWTASGTENAQSHLSNVIEVAPGATNTYAFTITGWTNENIFTRLILQETISNFAIGFIQHIEVIK